LNLLVRRIKRRLRHVRKSVVNAARAFRPDEVGYRLRIRAIGGFEVAYREGTVDERVIEETFSEELLRQVPEYTPARADVVLDVGAHIGTFSLLAARQSPEGTVYALEPSEESFHYLRINRLLNGLSHLTVERLALSGETGPAKLHHDATDGNWGHSVTATLSGRYEVIEAETLGDFLRRRSIEWVDFAKFNCEGSEFPILMNASEPDLRRIGTMLVMYHADLAAGYALPALVAHLEGTGFSVRFIGRGGSRGQFVAARPGSPSEGVRLEPAREGS